MKKAFFAIAICIMAFTTTAFAREDKAFNPETNISTTLAASPVDNNADFQFKGAARPNHNEISLTYGYPTFTDVEMGLGMAIGSVLIIPLGSKLGSVNTKGALALEYQHYIPSARISFGGLISYEAMDITFVSKDDPSKVTSTDKASYITLMPSAKCVWFNRKHVGMYSRLAVGIMTTTDEINIGPAFQIDPVGVEFGGQRLRGFAQLGFGNVGIFQLGIKTNF